MAIPWTSDFNVGHEEIDRQHQELFRLANSLLDAMTEGRASDELERAFGFLSDYAVTHFQTEERQMAIHGYAAAGAHKAEHVAFLSEMLQLRQAYRAGGPGVELAVYLQRAVLDLLQNHVLKTDQDLATFLQAPRR